MLARAGLLTLCTARGQEYGPGTLRGSPPGQPVPLRRGKQRVHPAPPLSGEAGHQWQRWLAGLPRSVARQEKGTRVSRERRESPAPAQRAAEGWGPLGKAGLALPAAPCPAAPGITSSHGRARSPAPAACQRRRRRPASLSHNSAPRLRQTGRCPLPEPVLTMVKVPREPLFIFCFLLLRPFRGHRPLVGLQTARRPEVG